MKLNFKVELDEQHAVDEILSGQPDKVRHWLNKLMDHGMLIDSSVFKEAYFLLEKLQEYRKIK